MKHKIATIFIVGTFHASTANAGDYSIEKLGDLMQIAIPTYAAGMAVQEDGWHGILQFSESYIGTAVTTELLKRTIPETRPNGADDKSFPSGHTSSAFSGATFIHARYGWKRAIIPYAAATFVGYSRVYSNWHYTHDVVAGAAIAALWSFLVTDKYSAPVSLSADTSGFQLRAKIAF